MIEFDGILPPLVRALDKRGYESLTPVQEAVLAPDLAERDMLVSAQTGSGKTVAFGLAIAPTLLAGAERFENADEPLALVIAPTRELALQVRRELGWLYEDAGSQVASCVGGMDMRSERKSLARGAHIVVGTPGRLRDHIQRGSLKMTGMRAVILDEADEMLDLGFREDLEFILEASPEDRRTLMFSATVSKPIAGLAKLYQRDAARVSTVAEKAQHGDIEYRALNVPQHDRENAIINVLRYYEAENALVFCATRAAVNHMSSRFNNRGFSVVALSGELSQSQRSHALQAMRDGRARVCIATDVAARGIDLPNLELVIHADLPKNRESLLHRSGRTGRAGRKGVSVLIVPKNARVRTERLLKGAGIGAGWANPPSVEDVLRRDDERIISHDALTGEIGPDADELAKAVLEKYGAERVAAAFVHMARAGRTAPEELSDPGQSGDGNKPRAEFGESVWLSLSVGRNQDAEPRWLLPLLCGAGNLTKREIGAIKMQHNETFVQLAEGSVGKFFAAVGPDNILEKGVSVKLLDGVPAFAKASADRPKKHGASARENSLPRHKAKQRAGDPSEQMDSPKKSVTKLRQRRPEGKPADFAKRRKPKKS